MNNYVDIFRNISTSTISDAMDRLGIEGTCLGIAPLDYGFRLAGRAFTVKYGPVGQEKGTVGDYIDDVPEGWVVVLDNSGRTDCTVWGDILTSVAHQRGISGVVINGVCRDIHRSLELGFPVFSRGRFMRTGKDRVMVEAYNVPISMGTVRVSPEDLLIGDADGVVVIPKGQEDRILQIALEIDRAEEEIRNDTARGMRLDEARQQHGYHSLQTRATVADPE